MASSPLERRIGHDLLDPFAGHDDRDATGRDGLDLVDE